MNTTMKLLLAAVLGTAALFADGKPAIVKVGDLTPEALEDFSKGKLQNMAVLLPAGQVLPLRFSVRGEFLALDTHEEFPAHVKVLKNCLMQCTGEDFLFSLDGKKWQPFEAFFTGKLGASLSVEEIGPLVGIECELNKKN